MSQSSNIKASTDGCTSKPSGYYGLPFSQSEELPVFLIEQVLGEYGVWRQKVVEDVVFKECPDLLLS